MCTWCAVSVTTTLRRRRQQGEEQLTEEVRRQSGRVGEDGRSLHVALPGGGEAAAAGRVALLAVGGCSGAQVAAIPAAAEVIAAADSSRGNGVRPAVHHRQGQQNLQAQQGGQGQVGVLVSTCAIGLFLRWTGQLCNKYELMMPALYDPFIQHVPLVALTKN